MTRRFWLLLVAVVISFLLAWGVSYLAVVSQNGAAEVTQPATDYGPAL
jgi:hypothetical protein